MQVHLFIRFSWLLAGELLKPYADACGVYYCVPLVSGVFHRLNHLQYVVRVGSRSPTGIHSVCSVIASNPQIQGLVINRHQQVSLAIQGDFIHLNNLTLF